MLFRSDKDIKEQISPQFIKLAKSYNIAPSKSNLDSINKLGFANLAKDYIVDAVGFPDNFHIKYGSETGTGNEKLLNFLKNQYKSQLNKFFRVSTFENTWDLCNYQDSINKNDITGVFNKSLEPTAPSNNTFSIILKNTDGSINSKKS